MSSLALIYAAVPAIDCKHKCTASCGLIAAAPPEVRAFQRATGKPFPDGFQRLVTIGKGAGKKEEIVCPELNALGLCGVREHRPLLCRLWGVVDSPLMKCPHGCVPERYLTDAEARELIRQTWEIEG